MVDESIGPFFDLCTRCGGTGSILHNGLTSSTARSSLIRSAFKAAERAAVAAMKQIKQGKNKWRQT